jgi:hypothetical protein
MVTIPDLFSAAMSPNRNNGGVFMSIGIDSASAVWGRFRLEPIAGGTKTQAVRLLGNLVKSIVSGNGTIMPGRDAKTFNAHWSR